MSLPFRHLVVLEPLGLLYGSSGRFLSAENLVGQAGEHFPPDSPAMAGLLAARLPRSELRGLHTAGPFWWCQGEMHLPAPLNLLQEQASVQESSRRVVERLVWQEAQADTPMEGWLPASGRDMPAKPTRGGWIPLTAWDRQGAPDTTVRADPWKAVPHLHPRLREEEKVSAMDEALFLELAIALKPGVGLAYLTSHAIPEGRYRFGGEGHLVELRLLPLPPLLTDLLARPLVGSFALVTPGLWGGSRLSVREPLEQPKERSIPARQPWHFGGRGPALLTDRPRAWRHRLGAGPDGKPRLSRGRWAVPAGSCYHVPPGLKLPPWPDWPENWFPREGLSFRQLGTGLALPIP